MKLVGDYHTHTTYTHGVSTIEENVVSAIEKGLKQIAITEHSFSHMMYGITVDDYRNIQKDIANLRVKYPQIEILCGIETNLMGFDGKLDIDVLDRKEFDVVVVGYHYTYKPSGFKNFFQFFLPGYLGISSKKRIQKNTMAYINAMNRYDVDILAHLNYGIKVDPVAIAKEAVKHNVYIELNGKRIFFSDKEMLEMAKTGVKFIIDSDAHNKINVGKNNEAYALIERLNIPQEQVVNLNQFPKFKNYNKNEKY